MEALIGITGRDFVLLAADRLAARSIVVMKSTEDKILPLNNNTCIAYSGEPGDTTNFAQYIQRNVHLYTIRNDGMRLNTKEAAHFARRELANALRSRNPYNVFSLIGGWSENEGPELYWMDYLAALSKGPFAVHGYASYFLYSILDCHYREGMELEEAIQLIKLCLKELQTRFIANLPEFTLKIIGKDGIQEMTLNASFIQDQQIN